MMNVIILYRHPCIQGAPPLHSMFVEDEQDDPPAEEHGNGLNTEVYGDPFEPLQHEEPLHTDVEDSITLGEIMLAMFDWVASHKSTKVATEDVWSMLRSVCPPGTSPGTYAMAEKIIKRHMADSVVIIDVCRHDCVAYFNYRSSAFAHLQYMELQECPVCYSSRYVTMKGQLKPAKVMYWFPSAHYFQYLFSDKDIVHHLYNDLCCSTSPIGSVRASYGYNHKVLRNPRIACDPRHQAVILSTDGMPYFKDVQCRSGWPVLMRSAMLPDGLWNSQAYTHMVAFQASDYLDEDPDTGVARRVKRYTAHMPH
jgi:hypothetical protein